MNAYALPLAALLAATTACVRNPEPSRPVADAGDLVEVCVVAPTESNGLREVPARREDGTGRLLLSEGGRLVPFEERYPISLLAGYAGNEPWFAAGEPVTFAGERYERTGDLRRVPEEQLARVGDYRGVLVFAAAGESAPPAALYLPAEPGCIFQAYVRAALLP